MKILNKLFVMTAMVATSGVVINCGGADNSGDLIEHPSPINVTILEGNFDEGDTIEFRCNDASDLKVDWGDGIADSNRAHTYNQPADRIIISGRVTTLSVSDENGAYTDGNHSINSVAFSNTITALPAYSFNAWHLDEAVIPSSVTNIGEHAFNSTDHLITFWVSANQKPSGWADAWSHVDSFADIVIWGIKIAVSDNFVYIMTNYNGVNSTIAKLIYNENDELNIPDAIVFEGTKYQISSFDISDSKVKTVHLPKYLKILDDYCFSNCYYLKTIDYSRSTDIEYMGVAFVGCPSLEEIFIPKTVKLISPGGGLVGNCPNISKVIVEEGNPYYINPNNSNAVISKEDSMLVFGCKTTNIPNNVKVIGVSAFRGSSIQNVTLPDSVEIIKEAAFIDCNQLKNVILSNNLQLISSSAFAYTALERITIPKSVKSISDFAFNQCLDLYEVDVTAFISKDNIPSCGINSFECYNPHEIAKTKTFIYNSNDLITPNDFYSKGWPKAKSEHSQQIVWEKENNYEY